MTSGHGIRCALSLVVASVLWLGSLSPALGADKSGVTPNTISLPSGPGSIEGLGESFQPSLNTGTAKYGLGVKVPPGVAGNAPGVGLAYEGGQGNGPLGFGWSLSMPFVQRQTDKGIPRYVDVANNTDDDFDGETDETDEVDRFITDSSEELVPTADGFFFSKNEGAFVRYRRVAGSCSLGAEVCLADSECTAPQRCSGFHWEGTVSDGTQLEFGSTAAARITDAVTGRVFKWLLERSTDTNGNSIVYTYRTFDGPENRNQRYLSTVAYGPGQPRNNGIPWDNFHFVGFNYEARSDWFEDGRAGFLCRTGMRLHEIVVGTQGPMLQNHAAGDFNGDGAPDFLDRKYVLAYDADPHWSLLTKVTLVGADGVSTLPPMTLGYTTIPPPDTVAADTAIIGSANTPITVMDSQYVDLVDLNGDALPDILRTDGDAHTGYLNAGESNGAMTWANGVDVGGDQRAWSINLATGVGAVAHLADMDGDGRADFTYKSGLGDVYYFANSGHVTWDDRMAMSVDPSESGPPSPFGLADVKTADIDFDKRIDIIQSVAIGAGADYRIWFNRGAGQYARSVTVAQDSGFMLSDPAVNIADVNGDRVPDIARLTPTELQVTAGLGHGYFAPLQSLIIPDYTLDSQQVARAKLADINGDGLVDLVLEHAGPGELWYWINRGNYTFDHRRTITGLPVQFDVQSALRWADMNGNGTTDLVYADQAADPRLQIVDIGRVIGGEPKPHMLVRIANGIGRVTTVEYRTSIKYALADAAAGVPWPDPMPFPVSVVSRVLTDDSLGHTYTTEFRYHDGYYDGAEKQFRGFARAEQVDVGDASAPTLVTRSYFDTGRAFEVMKGKVLRLTTEREGGGVFTDETTSWSIPPVTLYMGTNGQAVEYAHPTGGLKLITELGHGTERRLESESDYDQFGNQTRMANYGIVEGNDRSAFDDERIVTTEYTINADVWIIRAPKRIETADENGAVISREEFYYDDEGFSGNNLGAVSIGNLTMRRAWKDPGDSSSFIVAVRTKYDTYGNPIAVLDPLAAGGLNAADGHAREIVYDLDLHAYPTTETIHVGAGSAPLVYRATYDRGLGTVTSAIDFNGHTTMYVSDAFGRPISVVSPGDASDYPTVEYDYALAVPFQGSGIVNYVESRQLDNPSGADKRGRYFISRQFVDGLGRTLMMKEEAGTGSSVGGQHVTVNGAVQFNARLKSSRTLNPYYTTLSGSRDDQLAFESIEAPDWSGAFSEGGQLVLLSLGAVQQTASRYDAALREIQTENPDHTVSRTEYEPLVTRTSDENDVDPSSPHHDTPMVRYSDGLGRLFRVDEVTRLDDDGSPSGTAHAWTTRYDYDLNDQLIRTVDAQNNVKSTVYDGLKRMTIMNDLDRGVTRFVNDDASNVIETVDAKGQRITYTYDGANRKLTEDYHDEGQPFSRNFIFAPGAPVSATNRPDVAYFYDTPVSVVDVGNGTSATAVNTKGKLAYVWDLAGEEHVSYDDRGRSAWSVKRVRDPLHGQLVSYRTGFVYDSLDRLTELQYPDDDKVSYRYNDRNLVDGIIGGPTGSIVSNLTYWPSDQQAEIVYGNGVRTTYGYDARQRLTDLSTRNPQLSADFIHFAYEFDAVSNIQTIVDRRPGSVVAVGDPRRNTQLFQYDDRYRLTRVQYSVALPDGAPSNDGEIAYRYDRIGNMLGQVSSIAKEEKGLPVANLGEMESGGGLGRWNRTGRGPSEPPGPHAMTAIRHPTAATRNYPYDANGNMTELDGLVATWDFEDRLVTVENAELRADYTYDTTGYRVTKLVTWKNGYPGQTSSPVTMNAQLRTTSVIYVGKHFEARDLDAPIKYVWNGDTRVARITGSLSSKTRVQRIRVATGWNLVSIALTSTNVEAQLRSSIQSGTAADAASIIESIFKWDPQGRVWAILPAKVSVPAGSVLWIKATGSATLRVVGTYDGALPNPRASPGGDFLPVPGLEAWNLLKTLNSQPSIAFWRFDAAHQEWQAKLGELPSLIGSFAPILDPGEALFVKSPASAELERPDPALALRFYHQDHLGSSSVVSDAAGQLVEESANYPFGAARVRYQPRGVGEAYQFAQKERDQESGLQYFEARYDAAAFGRFLSVDPVYSRDPGGAVGNPQLGNPYAYVLNHPIRLVDPSGGTYFDTAKKIAGIAVKTGWELSPLKSFTDDVREYGHDIVEHPIERSTGSAKLLIMSKVPVHLPLSEQEQKSVINQTKLASWFIPPGAGTGARAGAGGAKAAVSGMKTVAPKLVSVTKNGGAFAFSTKTTGGAVKTLAQRIEQAHQGVALYIGSGGHGAPGGASFITENSMREGVFVAEDLATVEKLQKAGIARVLDLRDPKQLQIFRNAEQMAAKAGQDHIATIRAWCFSCATAIAP